MTKEIELTDSERSLANAGPASWGIFAPYPNLTRAKKPSLKNGNIFPKPKSRKAYKA